MRGHLDGGGVRRLNRHYQSSDGGYKPSPWIFSLPVSDTYVSVRTHSGLYSKGIFQPGKYSVLYIWQWGVNKRFKIDGDLHFIIPAGVNIIPYTDVDPYAIVKSGINLETAHPVGDSVMKNPGGGTYDLIAENEKSVVGTVTYTKDGNMYSFKADYSDKDFNTTKVMLNLGFRIEVTEKCSIEDFKLGYRKVE